MAKVTIPFSKLCHFTDRQLEATRAMDDHDFVLYGGALGGGKSYWLRWALVRFLYKTYLELNLKNVTVGMFCEDYPALYDRHLSKIKFEFPAWLGAWEASTKTYRLIDKLGGGNIAFRNLDDVSKYQSSEFAAEAVDELTKNQKDVFDFLRSRKRWPGIKRTKFIAGTNPGSVGHGWVKKLWITKEYEEGEEEQEQFIFVPAKVEDNPHLPEEYYKSLAGLPPDMKKALLDGSWDLFKGQVFTEWRQDVHVTSPFPIPDTFRKFIGIDYGSTAPFAAYWIAVDWDGNYWVYREYYAVNTTAEDNAKAVVALMADDEVVEMAVADRSIFSKQGYGETIADILKRNGIGVPGTKIPALVESLGGPGSRQARTQLLKQKLSFDAFKPPKIKFFDTCVNAIRTIPSLVYDEKKVDDVDCFVKGTEVTTPDGQVLVENISVGDIVCTPIGNREVIKAGISGNSERVIEVTLSNGKKLKGTANHCVFVVGKGMVEMQKLTQDDILLGKSLSNIKLIWLLRKLHIKVSYLGKVIVGNTIHRVAHILNKAFSHYTEKFIKITLVTYLMVATFITRIIIATITNHLISKLWSNWNTQDTITKLTKIIQRLKQRCTHGLAPKEEKKFFETTQERCTKTRQKESSRADIVAILLRLSTLHKLFVMTVRASMGILRLFVPSVVKSFSRRRTERRLHKHARIVAVGNYEEETVYRLTVKDAHLYYANGVLVTNTTQEDHAYDSITYLIQKLEDVKVDQPLNTVEEKLARIKQKQTQSIAYSVNKRFNMDL